MATASIGSVFQTTKPSAAEASNKLFTGNSEMYLGLFLAQLKNQDPTQPFDTAQMTEQLSQLNSSQQMIAVNKNLEKLVAQNSNSQASSLTGFINKQVEYLGDTFYLPANGTEDFSYFIDQDYADAYIEIRDGDNKLVNKYPLNKKDPVTGNVDRSAMTTGSHNFTWDGKNTLGNKVAEGSYKVTVVTRDSADEFSSASTFLKGVVSGVDFASSEEPVIFVGNGTNRVGVDLSRISAVLNINSTTI